MTNYNTICTQLPNEGADMPNELPANVRELRVQIARASLKRSFWQTFAEVPPDYVINDPQEIRRVEREWTERYAPQATLLAETAQQALSYLETQSLATAVMGFTSSVVTQSELNRFMHANPYLEELVAGALRSEDSFRSLLTLFVQLGGLGR